MHTETQNGPKPIMPRFLLSALIGLVICSSVTGCSDARGMANVQKFFETGDVAMIPGESGHFIARKKDGSIWYAFSYGVREDSIDHVQLLPPINSR